MQGNFGDLLPPEPVSDQAYLDYVTQLNPSPFSPERFPQPGVSCFHLNYEGPGNTWALEKILMQAARKTDCLVVYWQHTDNCLSISQQFFGLLLKYGFSQVFIRIDNKMPGWYIKKLLESEITDPGLQNWLHGGSGVPPGISGDMSQPELGFFPTKGDLVAGQLYLPQLQSCWKDSSGGRSIAEILSANQWAIQLYNEIDFAHEWDTPPPNLFADRNGDGYEEYIGNYYLLGFWACSLTNGFSWLLLNSHVVRKFSCFGGKTCYSYEFAHPRIPIIIPPIASANEDDIRNYITGCLDSFHKIPIHDYPVQGGFFSPMFGPGMVFYSLHAYAVCGGGWGYAAVDKILGDLDVARNAISGWNSANKFETPVPVIITEFGCAQVGTVASRIDQKRFYDALSQRVINTPLAWWVFAGRQCHPPTSVTSGKNEPKDWDVMALVDYKGNSCDIWYPDR